MICIMCNYFKYDDGNKENQFSLDSVNYFFLRMIKVTFLTM